MADSRSVDSAGRRASLAIQWSREYDSTWDDRPEEYVARGVVGWGRSRRLARAEDRTLDFKAYLGVQHHDPARWHACGDTRAVFFLSLFVSNRTVTLRTYPTIKDALAELGRFHDALRRA